LAYFAVVELLGLPFLRIDWGLWAILAAVPGAILVWYMYWFRDRRSIGADRLIYSFCFGAIAMIATMGVEMALTNIGLFFLILLRLNPLNFGFIMAVLSTAIFSFGVPALVEESTKYLVAVSMTVVRGRDSPYGVMLFGFVAAVAFATIENEKYTLNGIMAGQGIIGMLFLVSIRGILSVPLHCITGVLIGCGVSESIFTGKSPYKRIVLILAVPILLHGTFDWSLMFAGLWVLEGHSEWWQLFMLVPILLVIIGIVLCVLSIRRIRALEIKSVVDTKGEDNDTSLGDIIQ